MGWLLLILAVILAWRVVWVLDCMMQWIADGLVEAVEYQKEAD